MGSVSISFTGNGTPIISDPAVLHSLEQQDPLLQPAIDLLKALEKDAYSGTAGKPQGAAINFTLDNGVTVHLPNPGNSLTPLAPELAGKNINDAQLVTYVHDFLVKEAASLGISPQQLEQQFVAAGLTQPQFTAQDKQLLAQDGVPASQLATLPTGGDTAATVKSSGPGGSAATQTSGGPGGTTTAGGNGQLAFDPNSNSMTTSNPGGGLDPNGTQWGDGGMINMTTLLNPTNAQLMTPAEMQMVAGLPAADQQQYLLQKYMEWQTRLASLLSNLLKMRHDTMMSIVGNIRSQ